jgi:hypothetical protein
MNGALEMQHLSLSLKRLSVEDLWRGFLYWGIRKICSKALEWMSIGAPLWVNMEGCSFNMAFEIKRYIKIVKTPCKQVSLFIRAQLGNLDGICLPGLFG